MSGKKLTNLITLRKEKGLNQDQAASKLGISKNTYCRYENGTCIPNLQMLTKMADLFDCSIDFIAGRETGANKNYYVIKRIKKAQKDLDDAISHLLKGEAN